MKHKCFQIGFLWFIHIRFYVSIHTHISGASVGWTVLTNNSCTISFNVIWCANDMFIVTIIHRSPTHAPPREGERSLCRPPPQSLTYDRHSCNSRTIIWENGMHNNFFFLSQIPYWLPYFSVRFGPSISSTALVILLLCNLCQPPTTKWGHLARVARTHSVFILNTIWYSTIFVHAQHLMADGVWPRTTTICMQAERAKSVIAHNVW